jgi:hypothetical protein
MDWDEIKTRWQAHRGNLARRWQLISERELDEIAGDRQRLCERIQEVYCICAHEAERQVSDWEQEHLGESASRRTPHRSPAQPIGNTWPGKQICQGGYMDEEDQREKNESARPGADSHEPSSRTSRGDESQQ